MLVVGLTGGIGCGKSEVSKRLATRGAVVIDADVVTREVQISGGPAFQPIVDRFGQDVVGPDGELDRERLASIVFPDPAALADLTGIVHPMVGKVMAERMAALASSDQLVVLDVPLLVESTRTTVEHVIVVDCAEDVAVDRLVHQRGMTEADVRARMARQATRADRLARADFVIDNSGSLTDLDAEVARCWTWLTTLGTTVPSDKP